MALKDILDLIANEVGLDLTDPLVKSIWIKKVTKAAEDIYNKYDIPGSLREQVFDADVTSRQMTLPYYVYKIRGVRSYDSLGRVKQVDMRPRYFYGSGWGHSFLTWRNKGQNPLCRDLATDSILRVNIPFPELASFSVYIEGSTSTSDRIIEELIFTPNITTLTTANQFTNNAPSGNPQGIRSIRKSKTTINNLGVFDINDLLLAEIANDELQSSYKLIQITNYDNASTAPCDCYEILYKTKFTPFKDDYSTFPCPDCEDAIYWMTLARYFALKKDNDSTKLAIGYSDKCAGILNELTRSDEDQTEKEIQFEPNQYLDVICPSGIFYLS